MRRGGGRLWMMRCGERAVGRVWFLVDVSACRASQAVLPRISTDAAFGATTKGAESYMFCVFRCYSTGKHKHMSELGTAGPAGTDISGNLLPPSAGNGASNHIEPGDTPHGQVVFRRGL